MHRCRLPGCCLLPRVVLLPGLPFKHAFGRHEARIAGDSREGDQEKQEARSDQQRHEEKFQMCTAQTDKIRRGADDEFAAVLNATKRACEDLQHWHDQHSRAQLNEQVDDALGRPCGADDQTFGLPARETRRINRLADETIHYLVEARDHDRHVERHDVKNGFGLRPEHLFDTILKEGVAETLVQVDATDRDMLDRCGIVRRIFVLVAREWGAEGKFEQLQRGDEEHERRDDELRHGQ
mmetsp:Transcript_47595/g.136898  ORF Transcript_47595/g.136898 Transcript_47595/m.136898 type:complete len:238 (-) Transcript_47595:1723-2436(-)